MRSKYIIFNLIFTILITFSASAQITFKGVLLDELRKPISNAVVKLTKNDSTYAQSVSSEDGRFSIPVKDTGEYYIVIHHTAFLIANQLQQIDQIQKKIDTVFLISKTNNLKEVTITAQKSFIEQKVDRTVFNIENNVSLTGGTALDAMSKLPGLRVTSSGGIALTGKGEVNVMINNQLLQMSGDDLLNFLKAIPVSDISKIEVITNPPSNYDAQGNFGLINIVTKKKHLEGISGSIFSTYTKATFSSETLGSILNYNKDKLNINVNLNLNNNIYDEQTNPTTFYPGQTWIQNRNAINKTRSGLGRISLEYQLGKKSLIAFNYTYSDRKTPDQEQATTTIIDQNSAVDSVIRAHNENTKGAQSNNFNIHFEQNIDTLGKKISIDAGYFVFNSNISQISDNITYSGNTNNVLGSYLLQSMSPLNVKAYTTQVDVFYPNHYFNFSFGGKLSFIPTNTNSNYYTYLNNDFQYNSTLSNAFRYDENVQALYVNGNKKFGKWEAQLGFRGEYTETNGNSLTENQTTITDYFKIFPTAYLTYKSDDNNTYSFSYGSRINRPSYWYLNPFKQFVSPYFYYEGNPFLRPSYSDNLQLNYNYKGVFVTSLSANFLHNVFDQITIPDSVTKVSVLTRLNYYSQRNIGLSESFNFASVSWFESYNSASVYNITTRSYISYASGQSGWSGDLYSGNTFIFNQAKTIMASADFSYTFPQISGIAHFKSMYNVDLGIKTLLDNKRITIAANAADIFKTSIADFYWVTNDITTSYRNYFDSRKIRFSISYSFGQNSNKSKQIKDSNSDESRRAN